MNTRRALVGLLLGPLVLRRAVAVAAALALTGLLTLVTQVGGLWLWPTWGLLFEATRDQPRVRRWALRLALSTAVYLVGSLVLLPVVAERTGRVRLPLGPTASTPVGPQSWLYVLANRSYVRPHTAEAFLAAARATAAEHPGTVVRYLDAGFPFATIPLLPHLSHRDGERIDVALLFERDGRPVDQALSPIGYWGYARESVGSTCEPSWTDLRWDLDPLQPLWPDLALDVDRNRAFLRHVAADPRVCSILLEPTLHGLLAAPKLHANPCGVARHDDHSHLTIRQTCR